MGVNAHDWGVLFAQIGLKFVLESLCRAVINCATMMRLKDGCFCTFSTH